MRRSEARRVIRAHLEGIRPCYLGFGLFWAVSFASSLTPAPLLADDAAMRAHTLANAAGMALAVLIAGILGATGVARRVAPGGVPQSASTFGVVVSAVLVVLGLAFNALPAETPSGSSPLASPAVAALIGLAASVGSVGFLLAQQRVLAAIGPGRAATVGSASAALSALGCVGILAIPTGAARLVVETLVLASATALQLCSVRTVASLRANALPASPGQTAPAAPLARQAWRQAIRELWRPSLCVSIFALVWKLSTRMAPIDASELVTPLTLVAFGLAALLLCAHALLAREHASLLRVYRLLFPLMTGAFLLLPVLGVTYGPLLSALLMFGFELVNLLLICLCAQVSHELRLSSSAVYALGLGPAYLAMYAGQAVGLSLESAVQAQSLVHLSGISLGAVYLLSMVLLVITRSGQRGEPGGEQIEAASRAEAGAGAGESPASASTPPPAPLPSQQSQPTLASLAEAAGLTPRETDIAAMVARGNSVPAIADRLAISQNTVRGHTKHIYAKLGIHTKQELIDLVAQPGEASGPNAHPASNGPAQA